MRKLFEDDQWLVEMESEDLFVTHKIGSIKDPPIRISSDADGIVNVICKEGKLIPWPESSLSAIKVIPH